MTKQTRANLNTDIDTNLADNASGDISESDIRTELKDIIDSMYSLDDDTASDVTADTDSSGWFTGTNVHTQLQDLASYVDTFGDAITLDQADIILADGQDVIVFDAGGSSTTARPSHPSDKTVIWFNHDNALPTNMGTYDIAAGSGAGVASVNTQTGTSYTLVLGDAGSNVDMNNASNNTLTIPTNASVAFDVGSCITVTMLGAGTTTIQGDSGVTVNGTSAGSVDINNQYSGATARKIATDSWVVQGDIT